MKKKALVKWVVMLVLLCTIFLTGKMQAEAASKMRTIKVGKTYTTTLTGRKKHKVKAVCKMGDESYITEGLEIYVDGRLKETIYSEAFSWDIKLCKISSTKTLIYVRDQGYNDYNECLRIYEYKNKKLKQVADLAKDTRNIAYGQTDNFLSAWARGGLKKVGTNKLVVRWTATGNTIGIYDIDITYKVTKNGIIRTGSSYKIYPNIRTEEKRPSGDIWTAQRGIITYTEAGGSQIGFNVKIGERVIPLKVTVKDGNTYFQIKNQNGKTGWFKDTESGENPYFKEAVFAG